MNTPGHQQLAREAADQSLVLLKNAHGALPFKPNRIGHLAVIGRNANATTNMQGDYFGTAPFLVRSFFLTFRRVFYALYTISIVW